MATAGHTADGTYELDKTHSTVQFSVRHVGGLNGQMPLPNGADAPGREVDVTAHLELTRNR